MEKRGKHQVQLVKLQGFCSACHFFEPINSFALHEDFNPVSPSDLQSHRLHAGTPKVAWSGGEPPQKQAPINQTKDPLEGVAPYPLV